MATHRVELALPGAVNIDRADAAIVIYADDAKLGELGLSRGGLSWWPTNAKRPTDLTWEKFAALMAEQR